MKRLSMQFIVLVLLLACTSQAQYRAEQCTKQSQGTLDWRVKNSEVVITGTVTKIVSESSHGEEKDEFDVEPIREITPPNPIGHQTVGFVQLWRVVKGTIEHVTNYSYSTNGTVDGTNSPVIKLYGLWNDHVCGSYLNVGDTRIFFLRKLLDGRPNIFNRRNETSLEVAPASAYLGQLTSSIPTADDVLSLAPTVEKKNKKRRRGKRGKRRGRKRSQSGERRKKSRKGRKKRARRKRKTTESVLQSLRNLQRPKRAVFTPSSLSQMQGHPMTSTRKEVDDARQVLVVVSSPARITLDHLNMIEGIVELE